MKLKKFNDWQVNELSSQSSTKPIESDGGEPAYNYGNIQDILGSKYNFTASDAKLKEFEESILSNDSSEPKNDDYFIKRFIEFNRNKNRLTPPFQDDLIQNSDFYARAFYDEQDTKNDTGKPIKHIKYRMKESFLNDKGELGDFSIDAEELSYLSQINKKNDKLEVEPSFEKNIRKSKVVLEEKAKKFGDTYKAFVEGWDRFRRGGFTAQINDSVIKDVIKLCIHHGNHFDIKFVTINTERLVYFLGRRVDIKFDLDSIEWDEEINMTKCEFMEKIFNISNDLGYKKGLSYLKKVSETKNLYYSKYFRLYESLLNEDGVACASGGNVSGMGAVITSQPSSIPGDTAGATTGSGDIGAGINRNVIARPNGSRRKKKMKAKAKEMAKSFANQFKGDEYKQGGDKGVSNIMSFIDYNKKSKN